jgi:hypothetical protein
MDIDGPESGTQNIFQAKDYGVVVDFEELGEDEQEVRPSLPFSVFSPNARDADTTSGARAGWLGQDGRPALVRCHKAEQRVGQDVSELEGD